MSNEFENYPKNEGENKYDYELVENITDGYRKPKSKDSKIKVQKEEEIKLKLVRGKKVFPISKEELILLSLSYNNELTDSIVYNYEDRTKIVFDSGGKVLHKQSITRNEYNKIKYTNDRSPLGVQHNISNEEQELKIEKQNITLQDALDFLRNPVSYNYGIDLNRSNMNSLVACMFTQKDQFDELFTVETCKPDSPLMRKYLDELSKLVNIQLKESDEVSNIEELEKLAYEKAEYKGKDLQTVLNEARDYYDYYRFLLMKGERIIITEEQKKYVDTLYDLIKKNKYNIYTDKKTKLNQKVSADISDLSSIFTFSDTADLVNNNGGSLSFTLFFYITDHIKNIEEYIEKEDNIKLRSALVAKIIEKVSGNSSFDSTLKCYIFICDKNYNYGIFSVRGVTMVKWIKELYKTLTSLDIEYKKGFDSRIAELNNLSI